MNMLGTSPFELLGISEHVIVSIP